MYKLILCFLLLTSFAINKNPQLTIEIQNIEVLKGNIEISVYNKSDKFLKEGASFKKYSIPVKNTTETIIIDDLPKGEYAFILYHDKNSDGTLNLNFLGIPKEPLGFSNIAKLKYAKPTFEECKFSLSEDRAMRTKLSYF